MTARVNAARQRAKADVAMARRVLVKNDVVLAPSIVAKTEHVEGREHWTLQHAARLEVWAGTPGLKGRWAIQVKITYDIEPGGKTAFVSKGSLGLEWAFDGQPSRSFLRYDVDVRRQARPGEPCHLNVLQPAPFDDRLHLRLPGVEIVEWGISPTLDFLSSPELRDEIVARLP